MALVPPLKDLPENFFFHLPFRGLNISTESEVKLLSHCPCQKITNQKDCIFYFRSNPSRLKTTLKSKTFQISWLTKLLAKLIEIVCISHKFQILPINSSQFHSQFFDTAYSSLEKVFISYMFWKMFEELFFYS